MMHIHLMVKLLFQNKVALIERKFKLFILLFFLYIPVKAQNLVLNSSFEDTISCSNWMSGTFGNSLPAQNWLGCIQGSPDFYHPGYCGNALMPSSPIGYQWARTGVAYEGFGAYTPNILNHHEFIGGILSDSLIAGHNYSINFYLSLANSCQYYIDRIGVYFSNDTIQIPQQGNFAPYYIPYTPQFETMQGNLISDTANWVQITGNIIAAGGERFFAIGNFRDDNYISIDSISSGSSSGAYYFIDDVSITDSTVGIIENYLLQADISPNPCIKYLSIQIGNHTSEPLQLKIYTLLGAESSSIIYPAGIKPKEIDVSALSPGVYFLTLQSAKGKTIKKFVKQ
jgi:hypothetical protein